MTTIFSHDTRVLMCNHCGAPVQAAIQGGAFQCTFCGSRNEAVARDDRSLLSLAPAQQPLSEPERLNRLRSQDGKPLLPPPSLQGLVPGGQLPAWKVQEAVAIWQATRVELRTSTNYEAAERLLFLTMVLANHFSEQKDLMRQRAMFESALDAFTIPRHLQIMRGYLSRCAARQGDVDAAEKWLQPCDPRSDDIDMDSAFRFSRAFIDTARGNFQGVIHALGAGPGDVPIADSVDAVCAVLRANAWEKMGQLPSAVQLLRHYMQTGGAQGRQTVQKVIANYQDWGLCSQSYAQATAEHNVVAAKAAGHRAGAGIHMVFLPLGILMFLGGLACGAGGLLSIVGQFIDLPMGLEEAGFGMGIASITLLPMGLTFGGIGFMMRRAAKKAERLRVHGIRGTGQIMGVQGTGMRINNIPQVAVTMTIQIEGHAPYQTSTKMLLHGEIASQLAPGATVPVRVDPKDPNEVLIEID